MAEQKFSFQVARNEKEETNRKRYVTREQIYRKWVSVCRNVNDHGDEDANYRKDLRETAVQAFNLVDFVMSNYIEEYIDTHSDPSQLKVTYRTDDRGKTHPLLDFTGVTTVIDLDKQVAAGFYGKETIVKRLGVKTPPELYNAREFRNSLEHSTETQAVEMYTQDMKYAPVRKHILALGKMLIAMGKLDPNQLELDYKDLRFNEGEALGYDKEYQLETLIYEDETKRVFRGMNVDHGHKVEITEWLPKQNMPAVFLKQKNALLNARGNGLARTEAVIFQCKTIYIVKELIDGISLEEYLSKVISKDKREDLCLQIQRIWKSLNQTKGITSNFRIDQFVVDRFASVWLTDYATEGGLISKEQLEAVLALVRGQEEPEVVVAPELVAETPEPEVVAEPVAVAPASEPEPEPVVVESAPDPVSVWVPKSEVVYVPGLEPEPVVSVRQVSEHKVEIVSAKETPETNPNDWGKVLLTAAGCAFFACIIWFMTRM